MSVQITWRYNGLAATAVDHGRNSAGQLFTPSLVSIEHNGQYELTNCKIYLAPTSLNYSGDKSAWDDYTELLDWADQTNSGLYGGIAVGFFTASGGSVFPSLTNKTSTMYALPRTGVGDSLSNGVLITASGIDSDPVMPGNGIIPANCSTWPTISVMVQSQQNASIGRRDTTLKMSYTYTS